MFHCWRVCGNRKKGHKQKKIKKNRHTKLLHNAIFHFQIFNITNIHIFSIFSFSYLYTIINQNEEIFFFFNIHSSFCHLVFDKWWIALRYTCIWEAHVYVTILYLHSHSFYSNAILIFKKISYTIFCMFFFVGCWFVMCVVH